MTRLEALRVARRSQRRAGMVSSPFNWCDRRCERCPLSPVCAVAQKTLPDDVFAEVESQLRGALERLTAEGVDLEAPVPRPPRSARAERLIAILEASGIHTIDAMIVRGKIERLAETLDAPELDDVYRFDTIPNLLLLERLILELEPMTAIELFEELTPVLDAIDAPARLALDRMIEAGLAPLAVLRDLSLTGAPGGCWCATSPAAFR